MSKPNGGVDRRGVNSDALRGGVSMRDQDIEGTKGLHSVAILFRILAGLLMVVAVLQFVNGITSTVEISYGVLTAEIIRLVIGAGLLWGAGDLADLFVKSHHDIRATRILTKRMIHLLGRLPVAAGTRSRGGQRERDRGDAPH